MWHEARRREKATQKLFNDHKRRTEKRREEDKVDPNSLLQINGIKSRLNLDPNVYKQAVKSLVAWQGDKNVTIDRFDVRATLTSIPTESPPTKSSKKSSNDKQQPSASSYLSYTVLDVNESESMKRVLNYERYRLLIQNDLDKVPEELRLELVAKSDFLSDAKMRKLRNNRFGTLGETDQPMTNSSWPYQIESKIEQQPPPKKKGATIGFNYNAVPPPPSLLNLSQPEDPVDSRQQQSSGSKVLDLEEGDNFEIDNVSISYRTDSKKVSEIARKYGLSCEEFILLAQWDRQDIGNGEILKELNQINNRVKKKEVVGTDNKNHTASATCKQNSQVYGPALPPELLLASIPQQQEQQESTSPTSGSPIGQRSPSGAGIPLRYQSTLSNCSERKDTHEQSSGRKQRARSPEPRLSSPSSSRAYQQTFETTKTVKEAKLITNQAVDKGLKTPAMQAAVVASSQHRHNPSLTSSTRNNEARDSGASNRLYRQRKQDGNDFKNQEKSHSRSRSRNRSPPSDIRVPRRASTPLAYKRTQRSSRSLSRERRNHCRSSRRRRRSSSSISSLTRSSKSPLSSPSSSDLSDRRRRRRRRSRSPSRRRRRR